MADTIGVVINHKPPQPPEVVSVTITLSLADAKILADHVAKGSGSFMEQGLGKPPTELGWRLFQALKFLR